MKTQVAWCSLLATIFFAGISADGQDTAAPADAAAPATAPPAAESATLFPVPDYTGSLGKRLHLTGDWGGARTSLAENGFQTKLSFVQVYQGVASGGKDTSPAYGGWVNLELDFDAHKLGLWPGGFLMLRVDANYEEDINGHTGALIPANTTALFPEPGRDTLTLSHVVFTQFLSEKLAVQLGKLDTIGGDMNDFAHGRGDQQFMDTAFCFNPVTGLLVPYSTLGAGLLILPTPNLQVAFSAIDRKGSASTSGFDTAFDGNTTYAAEARLKTKFFGQTGHQLLGVGYCTDDFVRLSLASDTFIPRFGGRRPVLSINPLLRTGRETLRDGLLRSGRRPIFNRGLLRSALRQVLAPAQLPRETDSWSVYYNFDQYLMTHPEDARQGFGLFGRFGVADGDTNPIQYFWSLGFGGTGMIHGRPNDRYGIGYYFMQTSDELPDLFDLDDEQGLEAYYTLAATPWLQISPDVQVINPARKSNDTTVVAGVRCTVLF